MTMRDPLIPVQPDDVQLALLSLPDRLTAILEKLEERASLEAVVAAETTLPPEEPTGLGAVVRDNTGRLWVRVLPWDDSSPWFSSAFSRSPWSWIGLLNPEILSHGYDGGGDQ